MAKNKKTQHEQNFRPISPENYFKEKVISLPEGPCWIGKSPKREALWELIATRVRPSGNLVYVRFRVDAYCRGVCSWKWEINLSPEEVAKKVENSVVSFRDSTLKEVVAFVTGAVEFAEKGGITPAAGYKIISNILKFESNQDDVVEDTAASDTERFDYEFGREGRHCLLIGNTGVERKFIPLMRAALGDSGFDIVELNTDSSEEGDEPVSDNKEITELAPSDESPSDNRTDKVVDTEESSESSEDDDALEINNLPTTVVLKPVKKKKEKNKSAKEESEPVRVFPLAFKPEIDNDEAYVWSETIGEGFPVEEYHYKAPAYPRKLVVRNKWVYEELSSPENKCQLKDELIGKILEIDPEELGNDLCQIILFEIGRTRRKLDLPSSDNPAILHSVILLTHLGRESSFPIAMELLRQGTNFLTHRLGSDFPVYLGSLLYHCGLDHAEEFEAFLQERGRQALPRSVAIDALVALVQLQPERRNEIIGFFRDYIMKVMKWLRKNEYCDAILAGYLIYALLSIRPEELLPEIQALLFTDKVAESVCGTFEEIEANILKGRPCSIDNFISLRDSYPVSIEASVESEE